MKAIPEVGVKNVLFETDFPHPTCLCPDPVAHSAKSARRIYLTRIERLSCRTMLVSGDVRDPPVVNFYLLFMHLEHALLSGEQLLEQRAQPLLGGLEQRGQSPM